MSPQAVIQQRASRKWLEQFGRALAKQLGSVPEGVISIVKGPLTAGEAADGWWVEIGVLNARLPRLTVDLWLDGYLDASAGNRLFYGIGCRKPDPAPFDRLDAALAPTFGAARRFSDEDGDDTTATGWRDGLAPVGRAEVQRPVLWMHEGGGAGYGRYEYARAPFAPAQERAVRGRAARFLLEVAEAWHRNKDASNAGSSKRIGASTGPARPSRVTRRLLERAAAGYAERALEVHGGGQGFLGSAAVRRAIDQYAMDRATAHYEALGFEVQDVHKDRSYDLHCTKGGTELIVEVKGTATPGRSVILTRKSRALLRERAAQAELYVLHSIRVPDPEQPRPTGGIQRIVPGTELEQGAFQPISYVYSLP